jgi:hypothetical protein
MNPKKAIIYGILAIIVFTAIFVISTNMVVNVNADEIVAVQDPIDGEIHIYSQPGLYNQNFGKVTVFKKRSKYEFENPVRFNDGGHGTMKGSVQYELPTAQVDMSKIIQKFSTQDGLENSLVKTVVDKAIYMTGPLMSSKESYAEKRNYLISYVEDQISKGVYKTVSRETNTTDPMTGAAKTVTVVSIVNGVNGVPERQEESAMSEFKIRTFNFSINALPYDSAVEQQIKKQQELAMDVQTSIADAKKAEQRAITVAKNGEADAAEAKWKQEVIKAKAVTEAQQQLEVATLNKKTAEQNKLANILDGQGEAEKRRLIMSADGALEMKLEAWVKSQEAWAAAFGAYQGNVVPQWVSGGNGGASNATTDFMNLMNMKNANDLGLSLKVPAGGSK